MFKSAWTSLCVSFITGSPGAGKSFCLVRDLHARLGEHRGKIITNLPIEIEAFSQSVAKRYGRDAAEIADQIVLIPQEVLSSWRNGDTTPHDLADFPQRIGLESIVGALFVLDECHLFCPAREPLRQKMWEKWLGEVRHEGWAGIYFVSQDQSKVGSAIKSHAELRFELTKGDKLKDPWFRIELYYWWELAASFTRQHLAQISVTQFRRKMGKMAEDGTWLVSLDPEFFGLYRSLEAAGGGTKAGALESKKLEYQRRSATWFTKDDEGRKLAPVWLWFLYRNPFNVVSRFALVLLVGWMCFGGGLVMGVKYWLKTTEAMASANVPGGGDDLATAEAAEVAESLATGEPIERTPAGELSLSPEPIEAFTEEGAARFATLLAKLEEPERQEILNRLQAMRTAFEAERAELKIAEFEEYERKQRLKEAVRIVAIDRNRVWLSDGSELFLGEPIHGGVFDGLHVAEVNRGRRLVRFNDGYTVGMSQPNGVRNSQGDADGKPDSKPSPNTSRPGAARVPGPVRIGETVGSASGG